MRRNRIEFVWPSLAVVLLALLPACGGERGPAARSAEEKSAAPRGESAVPAAADWCAGHEVPESECTRCNPELIPAFKAKGDWCEEHGVPESQCVACDPSRKRTPPPGTENEGSPGSSGVEAAVESFYASQAMCGEHGVPESLCAICLPSLSPTLERQSEMPPAHGGRGPLLRLATKEAARKAGIRAVRTAPPEAHASVAAFAQIVFDQDRLARIASPAGGTIASIDVDLGGVVRSGQPLGVLRSSELAVARGDAQAMRAREDLARSEYGRKRALHDRALIPEREFVEAEQGLAVAVAERSAAERKLAALGGGGGGGDIASEKGSGSGDDVLDRHVLRSPLDGIVVAREAMPGQVVDGEETILEVADVRRLWALLDIREEDAPAIREGQSVSLAVDALPGETFEGRIIAVASSVDPKTRMLRARAAFANPAGRLKANFFGRAAIDVGESCPAVGVVPREAIQRVEDLPVVFVRLADDLFETRLVRTAGHSDGRVEIVSGVEAGEEVVTDGAFLLKTQISKGSIGAGCCDVVETLGKRR